MCLKLVKLFIFQKMKPNCNNNDYCDFKVVVDNCEAQVEVCKRCGRKVIYNKVGGRIDNTKYLQDHIRDFCQPFGATAHVYAHVYGYKKVAERRKALELRAATKTREQEIAEGVGEVRDALRTWKRMESQGKTDREIIEQLKKSTL